VRRGAEHAIRKLEVTGLRGAAKLWRTKREIGSTSLWTVRANRKYRLLLAQVAGSIVVLDLVSRGDKTLYPKE
jgi:hypothetical protein